MSKNQVAYALKKERDNLLLFSGTGHFGHDYLKILNTKEGQSSELRPITYWDTLWLQILGLRQKAI